MDTGIMAQKQEMTSEELAESESVTECDEVEEEESCFQEVEILLEHGVSLADINNLKKNGINTIKRVQMCMRKKLKEVEGFNVEKIEALKDICCKISLSNAFMTASEVSFQRKQLFKLSTGSKALE